MFSSLTLTHFVLFVNAILFTFLTQDNEMSKDTRCQKASAPYGISNQHIQ